MWKCTPRTRSAPPASARVNFRTYFCSAGKIWSCIISGNFAWWLRCTGIFTRSLRAMTKKGRQLFLGKSAPPDKILLRLYDRPHVSDRPKPPTTLFHEQGHNSLTQLTLLLDRLSPISCDQQTQSQTTLFNFRLYTFSLFFVMQPTVLERKRRFLPGCMECRRGLAMRILSVRLSVCLSVCQTRGLWQNGRKICAYFYTMRKII